MEIYKYYRHNPPHLFKDGALYMLTAGTYQRQSIINTDERKIFWCDTLKYVIEKEGWSLYAWVVLDNHYHVLLGKTAKSGDFALRIGKTAKSGDFALRMGVECNDSSRCDSGVECNDSSRCDSGVECNDSSRCDSNSATPSLSSIITSLHKFTSRQWNIQDKVKGRKVWWNYWDTCITNEESCYSRINYIHWNPVKHGYTSLPEKYKFSSYISFLEMDKYRLKDLEEHYPFDRVSIRDDF